MVLCALVGLFFATQTVPSSSTYELPNGPVVTMPFPKPALKSQAWDEQVAEFGSRVHGAFGVPRKTAMEFAGWILEASQRQQIPAELVASLVFTESSFRKEAHSIAGAVGPAQVKPKYWSEFCGFPNLYDPEQNIYCGAQILAHLQELCGAMECALSIYNVGINSERDQAGERYVAKIDRHLSQLERASIP